MLSLATGKIVTRDQFKILSMPQSVIATLNAMAMKEGKKITQTQLHVLDELLFANSLDKSKMHPSLPTPPIRMPLSTPDQWTDPHLPICHQLTAFSRFLPSMCVCVCVYVCVCVCVGGGKGRPVAAESTPSPDEIGIVALERIGVQERDVLTNNTTPTHTIA